MGARKKGFAEGTQPTKEDVAEVRVAILERDDELPAGSDYHVTLFFIVDDETWNGDPEAAKQPSWPLQRSPLLSAATVSRSTRI